MMRRIFLLSILFFFTSALVKAKVIILDIDNPSGNRTPVAVPHFITIEGGSAGALATKMHELMSQDLRLTGMFDVWDDARLPRDDYDLVNLNFAQWKAFEVQVLIKGVVTEDNGQPVVQLRLYDVSDGKMLLGKQYALASDQSVDVVHRFVDSVMKALTGVRGPFESKIVASCGKVNKERLSIFEMDDARRSGVKAQAGSVSPAWSPDGTRVAYAARLKNDELHVFVSGSGQVTGQGWGTVNITPAWTPDGNLVISSSRNEDMELYLVSTSGRLLRQITQSFNGDISPSVSADGQMVFVSERAGKVHIFKGSVQGGGASRMTYVGSHNEQPDWSPDATKIVFSSGGGIQQDIFMMEADGTNIVRLTQGEGGNSSPTFSPDGRFISFDSTRGGLFIMRDDGTNQTMIEKTGGCKNADWGPWLSQE